MGELLETLENEGLENNTSIVFTSNNGYHLGEHKMWGKNTNFEIANHVSRNANVSSYSKDSQQRRM